MAQTLNNEENRKREWEADRASLKAIRCGGNEREHALKDLYIRHARWLVGVARRQLFATGITPECDMQPEDVSQEVFLKLLRSPHAVRADYGLRPWFKMVARNLIVDCIRKSGGGAREAPVPNGNSSDEDTPSDYPQPVGPGNEDQDGLEECVKRAFAAFERDHPERAKALLQVAWEETAIQELAVWLGRTPGATREYLSQCRQRLRPYLEGCREYLA